jgi:predicted ester cyclase
MSEELKVRIHRSIEELNKRNLDGLDDLYTNKCIFHIPPFPDIQGLDAFKQFVAGVWIGFPDMQGTIEEVIVGGDTSVTRLTERGTHTGQLPNSPIPPTGKEAAWGNCLAAHYVGGKIVEQWEYVDNLGLLQQLGIIPSM